VGRTIVGGLALAVLACMSCAAAVAESADSSPGWDACLKTPTRACVLDEALWQVLSFLGPDRSPPPEPAALPALRAAPLETIAEAYANADADADAGNIQAALRVAGLIPSDHPALVSALRVIAGAQAKRGLENEAKQTFATVHLLVDSLEHPLGRAEAVQAIAKAEAEAGMATEADRDFRKALALAASFEISAGSPCIIVPSPENRLESLLKLLAEQQARAGDVSTSLTVARFIKYNANIQTETLVAIAASDRRDPVAERTPKRSWPRPEGGIGGRGRFANAAGALAELSERPASGGQRRPLCGTARQGRQGAGPSGADRRRDAHSGDGPAIRADHQGQFPSDC
jgi:hypothetical protein